MASSQDHSDLNDPAKAPEIIERNVNSPVDPVRINKGIKLEDNLNDSSSEIEINPHKGEFKSAVPLNVPYAPMNPYSHPTPQYNPAHPQLEIPNPQYGLANPHFNQTNPHYGIENPQYNAGNPQYVLSNSQYLDNPQHPNIPGPTNIQDSGYSSMYNQYSSTKNDRRGFIRKVYSLLLIQLSFTVFFIALVAGIPRLREGIKLTVGLFYASLIITLLLIIAIMCFKKVARRYPMNYVALFTFTLFESYIVAFISSFYNPFVVLSAVLLTFVVTLSLTIYAFKTKNDFTVCGGVLVSVTSSLILFGILMIFFHSFYMNMIFCEIAIILYSVFIVYDTQLIAGGRYSEISFDDYVIGALMLYVDIIGLFLYILSLLGAKK